jgi:phosphotransferase system HPr (HPr) family protein
MIAMVEITAYIKSKYGIHVRPAAAISSAAKIYTDTWIVLIDPDKPKEEINGKIPLNIINLNRRCGDPIVIRTYGGDERAAADAVARVIREFEVKEE